MDAVQVVSVVVAAAGALGAVLAYFKFKPGQREEVEMSVEQARVNVAQGTLNVAQGTINLVTGELEDQFKRQAAEIKELHTDMADMRKQVESAENQARKVGQELEDERRARRLDKDTQTEELQRKLEEERRVRRAAESREAEHAAEVRRLWVIVTALREAIRSAGIPVPGELMTGGIGSLPADTAPSNSWSEHSKDQDHE